MSLTKEDVQTIKEIVGTSVDTKLVTAIDSLGVMLAKQFKAIDQRFDKIDKRFDKIDKRFDIINKKFEAINKRFNKIESKLTNMQKDIDDIEANNIEIKLVLKRVDSRLDSLEKKARRNDQDIQMFTDELLKVNTRMKLIEKSYG